MPAFTLTTGNGGGNAMALNVEKVIIDKAEETRKTFWATARQNQQEHPNPKEIKALSDLLTGNRKL